MWTGRGSYLEYGKKKKAGKVCCRLVLRLRPFYKGLDIILKFEASLLCLLSDSDWMHSAFFIKARHHRINTVITC